MSINKVILVGNVGKDPDVRHLDSELAIATLLWQHRKITPIKTVKKLKTLNGIILFAGAN